MAEALTPWPSRAERRRDIDKARRQRQEAEAKAKQAAKISRDLCELVSENHIAEAIARELRGA